MWGKNFSSLGLFFFICEMGRVIIVMTAIIFELQTEMAENGNGNYAKLPGTTLPNIS